MRVISVVGWKNNGKTTLVVRLIEHLTERGLRVSTVKHAHHSVDLDQPGKDTWRHRQAGAGEVILATGRRWILMHELRDEPEPPLMPLLAKLAPADLVIVEGDPLTDISAMWDVQAVMQQGELRSPRGWMLGPARQ